MFPPFSHLICDLIGSCKDLRKNNIFKHTLTHSLSLSLPLSLTHSLAHMHTHAQTHIFPLIGGGCEQPC